MRINLLKYDFKKLTKIRRIWAYFVQHYKVCQQILQDQALRNAGLVWIQTVWHSDANPTRIAKKWFWKKSADDKKHA